MVTWFTVANHFHWVDMTWLWGHGTLAASVQDMLDLAESTGGRINFNVDAVGIEHLAAHHPTVMGALRDAVGEQRVEVVGGTYGQPYALFHGGESAIRQLTRGRQVILRHLGVAPVSFWEEEFCFFPQLPQMLRGHGYAQASVFFQWTWHTPHVPEEDVAVVRWEGIDGTSIPTATRNPWCLHQWPEDLDPMLDQLEPGKGPALIQQWVELLPSPDWMCRSELLVDNMRRLPEQVPDLRFGTFAEAIGDLAGGAPVRRWGMDDVFHGMSVGKNGDRHHRDSAAMEAVLLDAESMSVMAAALGRPYPHWSAHPTWELDTAWDELLSFQHHDNDECEGLCGHIGRAGLSRGRMLADHVNQRTVDHLAQRLEGPAGAPIVINPCGWPRTVALDGPEGTRLATVPAFGWVTGGEGAPPPALEVVDDGDVVRLARGEVRLEVSRRDGTARSLACGDARLDLSGTGGLRAVHEGRPLPVEVIGTVITEDGLDVDLTLGGAPVRMSWRLPADVAAADLLIACPEVPPVDRDHASAIGMVVRAGQGAPALLADTPYAVGPVAGRGTYERKYPTGDWMTSAQVFETIVDPVVGLSMVELTPPGSDASLLWLHDGHEGFDRVGDHLRAVLWMHDPWDENVVDRRLDGHFRLLTHNGMAHTRRWQAAQELRRPLHRATLVGTGDVRQEAAGLVTHTGAGTVAALWRMSDHDAVGDPDHVSALLDSPTLLRLVELDGSGGTARLTMPGVIRSAHRVDLTGRVLAPLPIEEGAVAVGLAPHQIATVAIDASWLQPQPRHLDQHRHIWAQVHRT